MSVEAIGGGEGVCMCSKNVCFLDEFPNLSNKNYLHLSSSKSVVVHIYCSFCIMT